MANATATQLQQLYIAYFARPGDPAGINYWVHAGTSTKAFAASMWAQQEFQDVYGELSVKDQINQLYINLFNREGDDSGLEYWAGEISSGIMELASIANDLIYAANHAEGSEEDLACLNNRTSAAVAYTANKISPPEKTWERGGYYYYPPLPPGYEYYEISKATEFMRGIGCEDVIQAYPAIHKKDSLTGLISQDNLLVNEQESEELTNTESNGISNLECDCNKELETLSIEDGLFPSLGNSYVDNSLVYDSPYGLSPSNNTVIDLTVSVDDGLF